MAKEFRSIAASEIREVADKPRTFRARVCNYNVPDTYKTEWAPGVFTRSLNDKLPKAVFSHDWNDPIGRVTEFVDSPEGLDVEVELDDFDAVPRARQVYAQLKSGTLDEFSFAFERRADEPSPTNKGITRITDADMAEVSPVLKGSVPGTRTLAVRSEAVDLLTGIASGRVKIDELLSGLRSAVSESDPGMTGDKGQPADLKQGAHKYVPTTGDGSVCSVCGGQKDAAAHNRSAVIAELRAEIEELEKDLDCNDCVSYEIDEDPVRDALNRLNKRANKKPYGDVEYCDKGYQEDGVKRYPVDTKDHAQAAWSYVNQSDNASKYSSEDLTKVKNCIKSKAKKFGIEISED